VLIDFGVGVGVRLSLMFLSLAPDEHEQEVIRDINKTLELDY